MDLDLDGETDTPDSFSPESSVKKEPVQEFLLCFRPMRDGDKKVDKSLRLVSAQTVSCEDAVITSSCGSNSAEELGNSEKTSAEGSDSKNNSASEDDSPTRQRPPKKRSFDVGLQGQAAGSAAKKQKAE
jgi:hypothetical protein